jgi:hypothetical protein
VTGNEAHVFIDWWNNAYTCQKDIDTHKFTITIEDHDPDKAELSFTIFESIQVITGDRAKEEVVREPFAFEVSGKNVHPITVWLNFFGHHNEIPFDLHYVNVTNVPEEEKFYLFHNPFEGEWRKMIDKIDVPFCTDSHLSKKISLTFNKKI